MARLLGLLDALRSLLRKERAELELDEELRFHLDREVERLEAQGVEAPEARSRALRSFGGVERWKEEVRDARGLRLLDDLRQDLAYGVRGLRRGPGFAAVAVITLGVGIGASTAVFSVVDGVLLEPLPYPEPQELVTIQGRFLPESGFDFPYFPLSPPEYRDYRQQARSMADVGAYSTIGVTLTGPEGDPQRVQGALVTANLFDVLGVEPILGRSFAADEDVPNGPAVVVLGHALWRSRYGGDPAIVGRSILANGAPAEVIGVMPPGFAYPAESQQIWGTLGLDPASQTNRSSHWLFATGRLAAGVGLAEAEAEMETLMAAWKAEFPSVHTGHFLILRSLEDQVVGEARPMLLVLLGGVGFVLLVVCANVANLLMARGEARTRELAVRGALGAGRWRLGRQLLTESVILALVGGAVGVGLAWLGVGGLVALGADSIPRAALVQVDGDVLAFCAGVSLLTAVLFGIAPAVQGGRADPGAVLREGGRAGTGGRSRTRFRRGLVAVEVALAVLLVAGAGLLLRSFAELLRVDPGFRAEGVLVAQISLPSTDYPDLPAVAAFHGRLQERLAALPGVRSVSAAGDLPLLETPPNVDFEIDGLPPVAPGQPARSGDLVFALPGYTEALGIRMVEGRFLEPTDHRDAPPVAVVNRTAAELYWPDRSPLGARIRMSSSEPGPWHTVVGVVEDVLFASLDATPRQAWYLPVSQAPWSARTLYYVVATSGDPARLAPAVRGAIWELDERLPLIRLEPLERVVAASLSRPRFVATLLTGFAAIALLLGAIGIYGVMAFSVAQRARELGIRMVLGARRGQTAWLVVRQGLGLALAGLLLGVPAALGLTRLLGGLLYGVSPTDPLTFGAAALALLAAASLACWLPARRAVRLDPAESLRLE